MRFIFLSITIFLWINFLSSTLSAKSWNNIVPLKTTRAEVVALLGEPRAIEGRGPDEFFFENQKVFIKWARPHCFVIGTIEIGREMVGPDALVHDILVQPGESNQLKYESEVREFLISVGASDCRASENGACGYGNIPGLGFAYSRGARGITNTQYFPTDAELDKWFHTLIRCSLPAPIK